MCRLPPSLRTLVLIRCVVKVTTWGSSRVIKDVSVCIHGTEWSVPSIYHKLAKKEYKMYRASMANFTSNCNLIVLCCIQITSCCEIGHKLLNLNMVKQYVVCKSSISRRIGGNLKQLQESTNTDRKWLKTAFSIANCRFRLPICNLKHCFNVYRSALLDSCDSSQLPPIRSKFAHL